jgi:DNA-binding transcriptional MerR regulator
VSLSTKQLADLAGTTVKTVRHYHDVGLLDLPERSSNGYKQYTVSHLMRVLQIKRLSDLRVPLSDISAMSAIDEDTEKLLRQLDGDIESNIEQLQQVRADLDAILRHHSPLDVPADFGAVSRVLSDSDRALLMVYSRVLSEEQLADIRGLLFERDPLRDEYDALPADADDKTIQSLVERYAPSMRQLLAEHPWMSQFPEASRFSQRETETIVAEAVTALYNPAQRAVTERVYRILEHESATGAWARKSHRQ